MLNRKFKAETEKKKKNKDETDLAHFLIYCYSREGVNLRIQNVITMI